MEVTQGDVTLRVRRLAAGETVEIDTPNLAFVVTRPGRYRVSVDDQGGSTFVAVRDGAGEVYGDRNSYVVARGQAYRFFGSDLRDSEFHALAPPDALERFAQDRERRFERTVSSRYVSPDVIGYEDLDRYGAWSPVSTYGNVWFPRDTPADWAPYRNGHWSWIDPWGWTWVDDAPWGFAPFHYGRWVHADQGWGWVPGPANARAGVRAGAGCLRRRRRWRVGVGVERSVDRRGFRSRRARSTGRRTRRAANISGRSTSPTPRSPT